MKETGDQDQGVEREGKIIASYFCNVNELVKSYRWIIIKNGHFYLSIPCLFLGVIVKQRG